MITTTCTRCGGVMEVADEVADEVREATGGALPPMAHEACPPAEEAETTTYSVTIEIRRGPPRPVDGDDADLLVVMSETVDAATSFVQAVPPIGRALGRRWDAVLERAHLIDANDG